MTIIVTETGELLNLDIHLDRLRRLLADLERIASTGSPKPASLRKAPILNDWTVTTRPTPCLAGTFSGHPRIGDQAAGITSDLWVHAPHHGFARTVSRYYRLGTPAASDEGTAL
ncbi:DUF6634 family protein [Fulvimarina endophytica]|nr:DUF6634 family protein [Fulvimarina endophytica]